jgi:uncharacterized protein YgfB (UPF0149 family)
MLSTKKVKNEEAAQSRLAWEWSNLLAPRRKSEENSVNAQQDSLFRWLKHVLHGPEIAGPNESNSHSAEGISVSY